MSCPRHTHVDRVSLYPHSLTGILSASSGRAVRRNAALLAAYSFLLGLLALLGFFAIAAGVANLPEYADGFKQFSNNFAVPAPFQRGHPTLFTTFRREKTSVKLDRRWRRRRQASTGRPFRMPGRSRITRVVSDLPCRREFTGTEFGRAG